VGLIPFLIPGSRFTSSLPECLSDRVVDRTPRRRVACRRACTSRVTRGVVCDTIFRSGSPERDCGSTGTLHRPPQREGERDEAKSLSVHARSGSPGVVDGPGDGPLRRGLRGHRAEGDADDDDRGGVPAGDRLGGGLRGFCGRARLRALHPGGHGGASVAVHPGHPQPGGLDDVRAQHSAHGHLGGEDALRGGGAVAAWGEHLLPGGEEPGVAHRGLVGGPLPGGHLDAILHAGARCRGGDRQAGGGDHVGELRARELQAEPGPAAGVSDDEDCPRAGARQSVPGAGLSG
jgi:hypothetical protein